MPNVTAQGKTFECDRGANLRQVLLENGVELYNGLSAAINCQGHGTCGTCAIEVEGEVTQAKWLEKTRRSLVPHSQERNLRLACQTEVLGDIRITKFDGFWGQGSQSVWTPEG